MAEISVTVEGEADLMARLANMPSAARQNLRDATIEMQYRLQAIIRDLLSGEVLHPRTGLLRDSITVNPITDSGNEISGTVSANTPYAAIHEFGGTITPKTAQALTIPLEAVLTGAGVARYTARELFDSKGGVGGFDGAFIAKEVIFGKNGREITPLFALKQSVTIPARPYMSRGLDQISDEVQTRLAQAMLDAIAD